ncbi:MAG: T9SS type A sorting domain-containing protein [Ignavibacteriaceae bacterium]|nr:T9SS type A sorting domain-containing protein [Ignavibacteriaceae bacterium]
MTKKFLLPFLLLFMLPNFVSGFSPTRFPYSSELFLFSDGQLLKLHDGRIQFYFNTGGFTTTDTIKLTESTDEGVTWSIPRRLFIVPGTQADSIKMSVEVMPGGRICIVYAKQGSLTYSRFYRSFSEDNGLNWTVPAVFGSGLGVYGKGAYIKTIGNRVFLFYSSSTNTVKYRISPDSGKTYSAEKSFFASAISYRKFNGLAALANGKIYSFFADDRGGQVNIYSSASADNGETWGQENLLLSDSSGIFDCTLLGNGQNEIYLLYSKKIKSKHRNLPQSEIFYSKFSDQDTAALAPQRYTKFAGNDIKPVACYALGEPLIFFLSSRGGNTASSNTGYLYYSRLLSGPDISAPPFLISSSHTEPLPNQPVWVTAVAEDEAEITSVVCAVNANGSVNNLPLFDDGLHNDGAANDYVWGGLIGSFSYGTTVNYSFVITNTVSGPKTFYDNGFFQIPTSIPVVHILDENKIYFPLDNKGVLGDAGTSAGVKLDGQPLFFSGGFFLSGYKQDTLWSTAQFSSSRLNDYLPGSVGSDPNSLDFGLYVVNAGDSAFSHSWQRWQRAVDFGASFYDGNSDGIYTPVDLNSNGVWDPNEDKPDILGNETAWCIYNDGQPPPLRRYNNMIPRGIEISQTVFAFRNSEYSLKNVVFIRYRISNKSDNDYDSVYFSIVSDPDIGVNYSDDYTGSDTLLSSGFAYKKTADAGGFGANPPAAFNTLLQGPAAFIPGETFTDVNLNGEYDEGTDIPLMNALNYRGPQLGTDTIKGAKNLEMNAFTFYMGSHPTFGDPNTASEMRYYQLGGVDKNGIPVNVCTFAFGNGSSLSNCSTINPKHFFSGDPVAPSGWLNTTSGDMRLNLSTGPFRLKRNVPQYIITAYSAVRGSSPLNSVALSRQAVNEITQGFRNNLPVVVGVKEKDTRQFLNSLNQNYPNPASEKTMIRYTIANSGRVSIKVYDLLGNTVKILTDESKLPGSYDLVLDTRSLAVGIYFYEMRTAEQNIVKKFVVVR